MWALEPGEICHRPRRIDERNIAFGELCRLIDLGHCSLPSDLEDYEIMIRAIAANIPVAPLYLLIRATGVCGPPPDLCRSCLKPACIEGTYLTGKGIWRRDFDVAFGIRSKQCSPRLEIQQGRAANIIALKHYRPPVSLRRAACMASDRILLRPDGGGLEDVINCDHRYCAESGAPYTA